MHIYMQIINPFQVNFFLYPLKSTENMWLSDALKVYKRGAVEHGMEWENDLPCLLHLCLKSSSKKFFLLSSSQVTFE